MDGSSNAMGVGAGIVLEGPNQVLIKKSLHFAFKTSNNQAEYEAIIVGLSLAKEVGKKSNLQNKLQINNGPPNKGVLGYRCATTPVLRYS